MKKINLINITLVLILIWLYCIEYYQSNKNLEKIEKLFLENYNNLKIKNLTDENIYLTKLMELKKYNLNAVSVRGRFVNSYEEFLINKGAKSKIEEGAAVINEERLIGFVKKVQNNYAIVELLENLNKRISIKINNNYGFLEAKNNKLIINGIDEENMKIGDAVYTSGLTDIPGNIYIGEINKIVEKDKTFETKAYLSHKKDYNLYKYLLVVKE